MEVKDALNQNKQKLKNLLTPINCDYGDPSDPERFLFNVRGIKKAYLPLNMKDIPLIPHLIKAKSLSQFLRTSYYRQNFHSASQIFIRLKELRLKYDFLFWLENSGSPKISFRHANTLIRGLQSLRFSGRPIRLLIRKNEDQDISEIISLFILWFKSFSIPGLNSIFFTPTKRMARKTKNLYLEISNNTNNEYLKCRKTDISSCLKYPANKSKTWFFSAINPDCCRGLEFSILYCMNTDQWQGNNKVYFQKVGCAAFPVVQNSPQSMIIIDSGPPKRGSSFNEELKLSSVSSGFYQIIDIPWHDDPEKIYFFDFPDEKIKFLKTILTSSDRKNFPRYPHVNAKYVYDLWRSGISLEALHWYVTESAYFKKEPNFTIVIPPSSNS